MSSRGQFLSIYQQFATMIRTQYDSPIRASRADSAGEYISAAHRRFLADQGTLPQFSCPGAHAQNGAAERKHHHILETARALLLSSKLPPHFWAEVFRGTIQGCTPYERLFGHPPNYSHLRCFGCACFVLLPPRERTKLTAQSVECVFLGYSTEHKGYRCYDPVARWMRISRDVTFDESCPFYPRSSSSSSSTTVESISLTLPDVSLPLPSTPPSPPSAPSIVPPPPPEPSQSLFGPPPIKVPPSPLVSSPLSLSPTSVMVPPREITHVYSHRPRPPPPPSPESSSSLLGPTPVVIPPREITHVYSRRPRPPPSPESSSSLLGSPPEQARYALRDRSALHPPDRYGLTAATLVESTTYREAAVHLDWQHAMDEEIATLERTGSWDLVPMPPQVTPISCKWVYKIKTRSDGSLERYKARLVARGFQQEQGRDYDETLAPVAHMTTVRTLLTVASVRQWSISQLHVKNAFLSGELREEVYMQAPPGYSVLDGMVCRLRRSLYGLKQAPQAWFERFSSVVTDAGFKPSNHDPLSLSTPPLVVALLLYVDDMIITGDDSQFIDFVKKHLSDKFLMSNFGPLRNFLGLEVSSTPDGIYLSKEKYI
jgi:hypothetical protein